MSGQDHDLGPVNFDGLGEGGGGVGGRKMTAGIDMSSCFD
jgi:hypothetical protein